MAVHAGTDVTGFGLAGHLSDMVSGNLDCVINPKILPVIAGVKDLADMGLIPEGAYRNMAMYQDNVDVDGEFQQSDIDMIYDAQTSGGLLLAVDPEKSSALLNHIRKEGFGKTEIIGAFRKGTGRIKLSEGRL